MWFSLFVEGTVYTHFQRGCGWRLSCVHKSVNCFARCKKPFFPHDTVQSVGQCLPTCRRWSVPQGAQHHPLWKHLVSLFICSSSSPQMTLSSGPMCCWFRRRLERIQGRPSCAQAGLLGSWGKAQVWISSVTSACNSVQS